MVVVLVVPLKHHQKRPSKRTHPHVQGHGPLAEKSHLVLGKDTWVPDPANGIFGCKRKCEGPIGCALLPRRVQRKAERLRVKQSLFRDTWRRGLGKGLYSKQALQLERGERGQNPKAEASFADARFKKKQVQISVKARQANGTSWVSCFSCAQRLF